MDVTLSHADEQRVGADLDALAEFSVDGPGCTRTLFSSAYNESRSWVADRMRDAGLETRRDAAGNLIGMLQGEDPTAPALMLGSHTDTVRSGGNFDGVVGVLGAIETVRLLRDGGQKPRHTILVVDFLGEESNDHGLTCLGSRCMTGELTAADLDRPDGEGVTLGDQCARTGLDPSAMISQSWLGPDEVSAYLELHIEQGPVLEQRGVEVGVVTAIVGIERLIARFLGRADHAGTMPMSDRRDALAAAAEAVLAIRQLGCDAQGAGVATTSRVTAVPGSPNVVPSAARLEAEMRSTDPVWLDAARAVLAQEVAAKAGALGVGVELDWIHDNQAQKLDDSLQSVIIGAAESRGLSWAPIPSGATHDAVHVARKIPAAMIFVPSVDGRSHCPEEMTKLSDIANGIDVLANTILALDRR
ncbi:M20 family metallo-hydrolase [Nocardioides allogilvus]|uniref:M20 family metallo-hydrolase n=1 Tax=Nocardioides allogilvus TaxID=2072017 RepID=UPI0018E517FB|nr:M20 family metallo-hydrolase [Nocardioides allogilvus]